MILSLVSHKAEVLKLICEIQTWAFLEGGFFFFFILVLNAGTTLKEM